VSKNDDNVIIDKGLWYVTPEIAAVITGVTIQTLITWRKQENPPPFNAKLKRYPLAALGEWVRKEQPFKRGRGGGMPHLPDKRRLPGGAPDKTPDTKTDQEVRYKKLQADKLEIELMQQAGTLVDVDVVKQLLLTMVARVKSRLRKMPTALAPLVHMEVDVYKVQKELEIGVNDALTELAESWDELSNEDEE
jgi:hypothetical protein